ncbi:MAG TPA: cobalamin B12-binding domain-containing protein, partial [Actinoplanes sp.]
PPQEVVRTLLGPVQREVGERWHRGIWTVAHEHQATAVVDAALHRVVSVVQPRPFRASIAVVCAEGDWHTLPARMAAEILRLDGWQVTFLGGSLPGPDLSRWLRSAQPDAVVVTCSLPTFGVGVLNIATAAAELGIPVVTGGRGMGADGRRANALGVGWAEDLGQLHTALAAPVGPVDHHDRSARVAAGENTAVHRSDIVGAAMVELDRIWPQMRFLSPMQLARTAEDFGHILDFVSAATLLDDHRVFTDFVEWLTVLLGARGVPPEAVTRGLCALAAATPPEWATVHTVLIAGMDRQQQMEYS